MRNQADRAADAGKSAGGKEGPLDRWVRDHPVWTFWFAAGVATVIFLAVYAVVWNPLVKVGFPLNDAVTGYVGALATTVVALAGALVSVMLARLALKLGYKATAAADQANEIQEQMRRFADPRLVEARESQKLVEQLDRLAESLRKQSAVAFASWHEDQPIDEIRFAYQRCSEVISDSALYRYCSKLVGESETEKLFTSMERRIFEARRALGNRPASHQSDAILTSRNAEKVAIEISRLLPMVEYGKQAALQADADRDLHKLALDLEWKSPMSNVSCCETAADANFHGATSSVARTVVADTGDPGGKTSNGASVAVGSLLREGARSVVHVLESNLDGLLGAMKAEPGFTDMVVHHSLCEYAIACIEGDSRARVDVIVATWDSTMKDEPGSVTYDKLYRPQDHVITSGINLESAHIWDKAVLLAKNPALDRALAAAMEDLHFLQRVGLEGLAENLERRGIDPADADDEALDEEARLAARATRRLGYIRAAIKELREIHARKGAVVVSDPYAALSQNDQGKAIIVIRPYFARIDMSESGSEWRQQNQWFVDRIGSYENYRWDGRST